MKLLIVESPTKAKTLSKFLGKDYEVRASRGHIRDLPSNKMNIDIEKDFAPHYELAEGKGEVVAELQNLAGKANEILLAMDPDREGEAIAYHVRHILQKSMKDEVKGKFKRITFHQITKAAVEEAIGHAGGVNQKLFEAQQARRVLDRLVGYSLSPVLWRKVRRGLSAGRVQSVALRLVVEREREIEAFKPQEYWPIAVQVKSDKSAEALFWAELVEVAGKKAVVGKGDERKFLINSETIAKPIIADLKKAGYSVTEVKRKENKRSPKPPYTTSTLQQAASNTMGWTAKRTMSVAQKLYEKGLITYHRTDSLHLAPEAVKAAREYVEPKYGNQYLPEKPRFYKTKSKSAQEAHEAIRPTDVNVVPGDNGKMDAGAKKLYGLVWRRFVSSQMSDAILDATTIEVAAKGKKEYSLRASGSVIKFDGWKVLYKGNSKSKARNSKQIENLNDPNASDDVVLPEVEAGEKLKYKDLSAEQKFTTPPPRYNDASLVKALEQLGIGRPSTYAPTIATLMGRGYMERTDRKFFPTAVGTTVTDFLAKHFEQIMDYGFTAEMEDDLDKIAEGKKEWVPMMKTFWKPFDGLVQKVTKEADRVKVPVEKLGKKCPECGKKEGGEQVIRTGRFGKFISCSRFPECKFTAKLEKKVKGEKCEKCTKGDVVVKRTRKGKTFYGCSRYPDCDWASWTKPGTESKVKKGKGKSRKKS